MALELVALGIVTAAVVAAAPLRRYVRTRRRRRVRARPFPDTWRHLLVRHLPLYRRLPADLRERLHADMQVFLSEKRFYGQHGLEVTDLMRLVIAAQACLLQLNQRTRLYPDFTSIIVYPDVYVAVDTEHDGPLESTGRHVRAGESWYRGPVVLSWADIAEDLRHPGAGHNVVLHEFAHKLDEQDGLVDGAPELGADQQASWPAVFAREFAALHEALEAGHTTLLDPYAASAPVEFFAVAVETFFDCSTQLRRLHPELYAELRALFDLDPAAWDAADGARGEAP